MSLLSIAHISKHPDDNITNWSVREVQLSGESERTQHIVGYIFLECSVRVTSEIVTFDQEQMLVQTGIGRIYHLKGEPGTTRNGDYAWDRWSMINDAKGEVDVTDQYFDFQQI